MKLSGWVVAAAELCLDSKSKGVESGRQSRREEGPSSRKHRTDRKKDIKVTTRSADCSRPPKNA